MIRQIIPTTTNQRETMNQINWMTISKYCQQHIIRQIIYCGSSLLNRILLRLVYMSCVTKLYFLTLYIEDTFLKFESVVISSMSISLPNEIWKFSIYSFVEGWYKIFESNMFCYTDMKIKLLGTSDWWHCAEMGKSYHQIVLTGNMLASEKHRS